jgi:hypothetical protein
MTNVLKKGEDCKCPVALYYRSAEENRPAKVECIL